MSVVHVWPSRPTARFNHHTRCRGSRKAQDIGSAYGKILRLNDDGSIPRDNPFVGKQGYRPEIYTLGHRDIWAWWFIRPARSSTRNTDPMAAMR